MATAQEVRRALEGVSFPGFRHSIIRYGLVENVEIRGSEAVVSLFPNTERDEIAQELRSRIARAVLELEGVESVQVAVAQPEERAGTSSSEPLAGVRHVVAVSSAKGGVGKSTVAVNLALALRAGGARVGLMDADVYGPSIPTMMGVSSKPYAVGNRVLPVERYGLSLMSMGFFLDDRAPVVWRGPMVMSLIRQFLRDVDWGELDVLVVDMPPGTGDAALTLAQQVPLRGAVIVTTPQKVALEDVERGIAMFRQVDVPVLGIIENMSHYTCPECGEEEEIFGQGGADAIARHHGVSVLGRIPVLPEVREGGDQGRPIVDGAPDHAVTKVFRQIADDLRRVLGHASGAGLAAP